MKKTKSIPAIVTLLGCLVAVIVSYLNGYGLTEMLKVLLIVIFVFLFIGLIVRHLFEKYIPPVEEEPEVAEDEGSVIEKGSDIDDGSTDANEAKEAAEAENENIYK